MLKHMVNRSCRISHSCVINYLITKYVRNFYLLLIPKNWLCQTLRWRSEGANSLLYSSIWAFDRVNLFFCLGPVFELQEEETLKHRAHFVRVYDAKGPPAASPWQIGTDNLIMNSGLMEDGVVTLWSGTGTTGMFVSINHWRKGPDGWTKQQRRRQETARRDPHCQEKETTEEENSSEVSLAISPCRWKERWILIIKLISVWIGLLGKYLLIKEQIYKTK